MTHRERVLSALRHEQTDRVPIDFGSTRDSTILKPGYLKLRDHLGIAKDSPVKLISRFLQAVQIPEEIKKFFDADLRGVGLAAPPEGVTEISESSFKDEWGVTRVMPPGGFYYDQVDAPLAGDITTQDILRYPWPDPDNPKRYNGLRQRTRLLRENTDYAIVLQLPAPFVHTSQYVRGFQDWFMDCAANQELLGLLFDAIMEVNLAICEHALKQVGDLVDIVFTSDDIGMQYGPAVSPETYRRLFKPRHTRYFQFIHERTRAQLAFHTCGSVWALLPDLVEAGVDILNPVQVSATNMDSAQLKKAYGKQISFWGAIDTQHVLPHGSPEEVREEVERRISDLAVSGGYLLCAVHNIQPDVPPENIVAMYQHAREVKPGQLIHSS